MASPASRSVAALLAACRSAPGWRSRSGPAHSAKARQLLAEEGVAALVGGREVRHQPGELDARSRGDARRRASPRRGRACRGAPCRVSSLTWTRPPPSAATRSHEARPPGDDVGLAPRARPRSSSSLSAPITSSAPVDPGGAQRARLLRRRDGEPRRPAVLRGARRGHHAVAVAVGLDDRAELRPARRAGRARGRCARSPRGRPARSARTAMALPHSVARSASRTSTRVTTPTRRPCSTTGRRLWWCSAISLRRPRGRSRRASTVTGSLGHQVADGARRSPCATPLLEVLDASSR